MKQNPVAKFAHKANKATVQRDRTKYQRKQKHKGDGRQDRHRPFCWAWVRVAAWNEAPERVHRHHSPSVLFLACHDWLADLGKNPPLKFPRIPPELATKAADDHGLGESSR